MDTGDRMVFEAAWTNSLAEMHYVDYSRYMDIKQATDALSALAQESRLSVFRLLVRAGSSGLSAGDIAEALEIRHNTLSTHLAILNRAELLRSRREGRSLIYSVDFTGTRELLGFLIEDCCQGTPEICSPALDTVLANCCEPQQLRRGSSGQRS